ncbi:hypothetical protein [Urbanus proteus nucleopolyhedrovirus]|uniref:Uncharacterized protein n=1 Tax=Urbanus proteus nucleopolyhedrovirus TaxID=1675866 RepID=A0A162GU37_9ABAC|nr:hypothetical protein [Urbanus proteus nucleopolyhedrovirus]AKR17318.1 hypothetical protein [Urbanus proteus nucleopolyhedrovirus]
METVEIDFNKKYICLNEYYVERKSKIFCHRCVTEKEMFDNKTKVFNYHNTVLKTYANDIRNVKKCCKCCKTVTMFHKFDDCDVCYQGIIKLYEKLINQGKVAVLV